MLQLNLKVIQENVVKDFTFFSKFRIRIPTFKSGMGNFEISGSNVLCLELLIERHVSTSRV
jgi:hypothetical protein